MREYEMTEEQLAKIVEASKSVPAMYLSGGQPMFGTPQENANAAWAALGREMGFAHMTVRPMLGRGDRFFMAEPEQIECYYCLKLFPRDQLVKPIGTDYFMCEGCA